MRIKLILIIVFSIIFGYCFIGSIFASQPNGYGSVLDNNNGNQGDILVNTGNDNGQSDVGTWVDSDFLKGEDGRDGVDGQNGVNGEQGVQGEDGRDGVDGQNGVNGEQGVQGEQGNEGIKGKEGKKGVEGKTGNKGDKGETGKGLKNAREIQIEGVIKETKKTSWSIYFIQDFANDNNTIGAKVKVYIGQSYAEQVREELDKRLQKLEKHMDDVDLVESDNMEVVPTDTGFKIQKKLNF